MKLPMPMAGLALILAAGCAPVPSADPAPPTNEAAVPGQTAHVVCQPSDYQNLVGRNRSEIPQAPAGRIFRVACSTCPVTMDFRDNRVTFAYDTATERVTRVSCG